MVANRFPDLELRTRNGAPGIRVEVKCIETIAEEKSANFDTLKKDLNPNTDFVVVFVWEWSGNQSDIHWDRAPHVLRAFVFHASSLAELRDFNWLSNPPSNLSGGSQGFDFRYAVNCRNSSADEDKVQYNVEEGNYGKLMRVWDANGVHPWHHERLLRETISTYLKFKDRTVWQGFKSLARQVLGKSADRPMNRIMIDNKCAGFSSRDRAVILSKRTKNTQQRTAILQEQKASRLFVLTDKYAWTEYHLVDGRSTRVDGGRKPNQIFIRPQRN